MKSYHSHDGRIWVLIVGNCGWYTRYWKFPDEPTIFDTLEDLVDDIIRVWLK
jgi:hypothetical protein